VVAEGVEAVMEEPKIGQVWRDMDPRGGPTFRIVNLTDTHALVTDLHGNRRRRIQRKRLRRYQLIRDGE
jgi:hypothetical protein